MKPIIISCGAAKIHVPEGERVQAWKLYEGCYYKKMLNLAIRQSDEVYILSAGYGLLKANDMVEPYDIKMTPKRAKQFRQLGAAKFNGLSLLGKVYAQAIEGDLEDALCVPGGMGLRMAGAMRKAEELPNILANLESLPDGQNRELIPF